MYSVPFINVLKRQIHLNWLLGVSVEGVMYCKGEQGML